jgi:outer membrane protein TolC
MTTKFLRLLLGLFWSASVFGQGALELDSCHAWAERNYPLVQQYQLLEKSKEYSLDNANKGYLPSIQIFGQATHQSEVTEIPFRLPNTNIEPLSQNQYRFYGELNQGLTDFLIIKDQKELIKTNTAIESQKIKVEMQQLKERVNNMFFGILLIEGQIEQLRLLQKDLQTGLEQNTLAIKNGVASNNSAWQLQVEQLKVEQQLTELQAQKESLSKMLGLFIGQDVSNFSNLAKPQSPIFSSEILRPELELFSLQQQYLSSQNQLLTAKNLPRLNLFFQGGAGRPGLNMLSNEFSPYYIGGARLTWNIGGLYTLKKERKIIALNHDGIGVQKDVFLFNTQMQLKESEEEILKSQKLMQSDAKIVQLQSDIAASTQLQLAEGTASSTEYILALNAKKKAQQNLLLHELQMLMSQYQHLTKSGKI